jgi:AraC-like DNA-binding protein
MGATTMQATQPIQPSNDTIAPESGIQQTSGIHVIPDLIQADRPVPHRDTTLVTTAIGMLRADLSISRGRLAKLLGVSASKLGKAFRAQTGEAFVDYRNRLRLERFFSLVRPGGGNVSEAAHGAGFGSYAQFHRVFRANVGKSPKEYVRSTALPSVTQSATA